MVIARRDQRPAAQHRVVGLRFLHRDPAQAVQPVGEGPREHSPACAARSRCRERRPAAPRATLEAPRCRRSRRRPRPPFSVVSSMARRRAATESASAVSFGSTVRLASSGPQARAAAAAFTASQRIARDSSRNCLVPEPRLGDDVDRAVLQRLQRASARPLRPGWNRSPPGSDAGS